VNKFNHPYSASQNNLFVYQRLQFTTTLGHSKKKKLTEKSINVHQEAFYVTATYPFEEQRYDLDDKAIDTCKFV
jgi:hypothetical protein